MYMYGMKASDLGNILEPASRGGCCMQVARARRARRPDSIHPARAACADARLLETRVRGARRCDAHEWEILSVATWRV